MQINSAISNRLISWKVIVLLMIVSAVIGAAGGRALNTVDSNLPPLSDTKYIRRAILTSLNSALLDDIRQSPDQIGKVFQSCRQELSTLLGDSFNDLNEHELQFVFCTILSYSFAPYGDSKATDFHKLLAEEKLNCANYPILSWQLSQELLETDQIDHEISFVGWDGGALGNHQIMFMTRSDNSLTLLLDPTIALVARIDFDSFATGVGVESKDLVMFATRDELKSFQEKVPEVILYGQCKPSDLLYYFGSMEHRQEHYGSSLNWPTPGAVRMNENK